MADDSSAQEPGGGTNADATASAPATAQSPLAAALREIDRGIGRAIDPNDPNAQPEGEARERQQRMREDLQTRKAALLLSSLMRTPDCALDVFRDGRAADPQLDVRHLRRARDILDALHEAIRSKEPDRWELVRAAWKALGLDRGEQAEEDPAPAEPEEPSVDDEADAPDTVASPPPEMPAPPTAAPFSKAPSRPAVRESPWASRPPVAPAAHPPAPARPSEPESSGTAPSPSPSPSPRSPEPARASSSPSAQPPGRAASSLAPTPIVPSAGPARPAEEAPAAAPRSKQPQASLDRTAEAPRTMNEGTSLHDLPLQAQPVLPFRAATPRVAGPSSPGDPQPELDVPMEEDVEAPEAATQRIRLHVLPFRAKAVPFEVKPTEPSHKTEAARKPDPSLLPRALPFDGRGMSAEKAPEKAPVKGGDSAPAPSAAASWPDEETTSMLLVDPPTEEPTTTRASDALLARTTEIALGRAPEPPSAGPGAARGHPSAATRVHASRPPNDEGAKTLAKEDRGARSAAADRPGPGRGAEPPTTSSGPGAAPKAATHAAPEAGPARAPISAPPSRDDHRGATTSLLEIEGYAAYRAEISLHPDDVDRIRARYSLHGAASYERLDAYWQQRLALDPKLRKQWESLCQHYAAWLRMKGR